MRDVAIDNNGYVYTSSTDTSRPNNFGEVHKIDPSGNQVWLYDEQPGSSNSVAIDKNGYIYSGHANNEVHKIDSLGNHHWAYTEHGWNISGVATDKDNYIYSGSGSGDLHKIGDFVKVDGLSSVCKQSTQKYSVRHPQPNASYSWHCKGIAQCSGSDTSTTVTFSEAIGDSTGEVIVERTLDGVKETDTFIVKVKPFPEAKFVVGNTCKNEPLNFEVSNACPGNKTHFQELSSEADGPNLTDFYWSFGDGVTTHSISNPTHSYQDSGQYNPKLVAENDSGCTDTFQKAITVHPNPIADFTAPDKCVDEKVPFENQSNIEEGSLEYHWNFADGNASPDENPDYEYSVPGSYDVSLVAESDKQCTDTAIKEVEIFPEPEARFEVEDQCSGEEVDISNQSFIQRGELTYLWDFGDGTSASGEEPTYQYSEGGSYTISLEAFSEEGCRNKQEDTIKVEDPGNMDLVGPEKVCKEETLGFSADEGELGKVTDHHWDMGDDNEYSDPLGKPFLRKIWNL